ncbi:Ttn [Symbiodinium sp. CCMP2456]|nr:Ttn [Symbiodinium sp. CCMP2456]
MAEAASTEEARDQLDQPDQAEEPEAEEALMDVKEEEVEAGGDVDADAVDYDSNDQGNLEHREDADFTAPSALQEEHTESQHGPSGSQAEEENDTGGRSHFESNELPAEDGPMKVLDLSGRPMKKLSDVQWYLGQEQAKENGLYDFTEVNLAKCKLEGDAAREVAKFCQKCPALKILKLHHNGIDDAVVEDDLMHIFKHCPRLWEVHLSHNWITEQGGWLLVREASAHLPEKHSRPLWLRMEHNFKGASEIARRCRDGELSVCFREDGRRCTNRYCKHGARIHLPFLLDDNKDWKNNGTSWSPWQSASYEYRDRYKHDQNDYGKNGYTGSAYGSNGYGSNHNDRNGYDHRGYNKDPGYGRFGSNGYDEAAAGRDYRSHRTITQDRTRSDRYHSHEEFREGRRRDSRSRTPPPKVRLTERSERFSPPPRRFPSVRNVREVTRVPSPPGPPRRRQAQAPPARRTEPFPPRKAPTPPRPRRQPRQQPQQQPRQQPLRQPQPRQQQPRQQQPRQPLRAPRRLSPIREPPNYQRPAKRNRHAPLQAPPAPLPRNLGNLPQVRKPPSPPQRPGPKLPLHKPAEEEQSSSYEYYSDEDEYSYDDDPVPLGRHPLCRIHK